MRSRLLFSVPFLVSFVAFISPVLADLPIENNPGGSPPLNEKIAPLFDVTTTAILADPLSHSCEELRTLPIKAKQFLFGRAASFQTPGMLALIIGPECPIFGDAQPTAAIRDPLLLVGSMPEGVLYFVPAMHSVIVSNPETASVAYAMELSGTGTAITQFLARRSEAERLTVIAKAFYSTMQRASASYAREAASISAITHRSSSSRSSLAVAHSTSSVLFVASQAPQSVSQQPRTSTRNDAPPSDAPDNAEPESELQTGEEASLGSEDINPLAVIEPKRPNTDAATKMPVIALVIAVMTIIAMGIVMVIRHRAHGHALAEPAEQDGNTTADPNTDNANPEA